MVASIKDPVQRHEAIESVARFWLKSDRQAASAWLTEIGKGELISRF